MTRSDPEGNIRGLDGKIYFAASELRCKGSGILRLASHFDEKLLALRLAFDQPMLITSACRSAEHNRAEGGAPESYHICDSGRGCCAVDIHILNGQYRAQLAKVALNLGWTVGVHRRFLHLDRRTDYQPHQPQIVFLY